MLLFGLLTILAGGASLVLVQACTAMGHRPHGKWLSRVQDSPHYREAEFKNNLPTTVMAPGGFWRTIGQWMSGKQRREPDSYPPVFPHAREQLTRAPASGFRATWLGHATVLLELDGYRVLTDPMFSERVTPVNGVGPKRFFPPPLKVSELPPIDLVLISHDHYDHLDHQSILDLAPRTRFFFVPLGVGATLAGWGIPERKIIELDWWEHAQPLAKLKVVATPARHFSGRGLLDRNKTQWSTWAIIGPRHRVFFGGDTGMSPFFEEIGARLGPFHLTLMPIGAYGRAWPLIHLNPEEAVLAHQMLRGRILLPTHWGTFNLALHSWTEPGERLLEAARVARVQIALPRPGEAVTPEEKIPHQRWWPVIPWERAPENTLAPPLDRPAT